MIAFLSARRDFGDSNFLKLIPLCRKYVSFHLTVEYLLLVVVASGKSQLCLWQITAFHCRLNCRSLRLPGTLIFLCTKYLIRFRRPEPAIQ